VGWGRAQPNQATNSKKPGANKAAATKNKKKKQKTNASKSSVRLK
jgi:hypothetical protein